MARSAVLLKPNVVNILHFDPHRNYGIMSGFFGQKSHNKVGIMSLPKPYGEYDRLLMGLSPKNFPQKDIKAKVEFRGCSWIGLQFLHM